VISRSQPITSGVRSSPSPVRSPADSRARYSPSVAIGHQIPHALARVHLAPDHRRVRVSTTAVAPASRARTRISRVRPRSRNTYAWITRAHRPTRWPRMSYRRWTTRTSVSPSAQWPGQCNSRTGAPCAATSSARPAPVWPTRDRARCSRSTPTTHREGPGKQANPLPAPPPRVLTRAAPDRSIRPRPVEELRVLLLRVHGRDLTKLLTSIGHQATSL